MRRTKHRPYTDRVEDAGGATVNYTTSNAANRHGNVCPIKMRLAYLQPASARKVTAVVSGRKGKAAHSQARDSEPSDDEYLDDAYEDAQEFFVTAGKSSKTSDNTFRYTVFPDWICLLSETFPRTRTT